MPKVCWTGWSTGATIKPHPVYDTVKGAAVGSNLPVRAAAAPAYLGVGVLQRSRQMRRPAQDLRRFLLPRLLHPALPLPAIPQPTNSIALIALSLSARSGGQGQKSPQSRTTRNQNRALKARKERFLTTVHSWSGSRISRASRARTLACGNCGAAPRRCRSTLSRPSPHRTSKRRYEWNRNCRTTACSRPPPAAADANVCAVHGTHPAG